MNDLAGALRSQVDRVAKMNGLDPAADLLDRLVRARLGSTTTKNALSGVWLGHRLHPLLTDVAIGSFLGAEFVDLLAPKQHRVGRRLIAAGILASVPTVASGLSDWLDTYGEPRRIGFVHAAGNGFALGCFTRSFLARGKHRGGKGRGGKLSSFAGLAVLSVTGYLGGHLAYGLGVGVDQPRPRIEEWSDVCAVASLEESGHAVGKVGEVEVLVIRDETGLQAIDNRCSHAGFALGDGSFEQGCVTCPGHGSIFETKDGTVVRGPATWNQATYEVRVRQGRVEVRS